MWKYRMFAYIFCRKIEIVKKIYNWLEFVFLPHFRTILHLFIKKIYLYFCRNVLRQVIILSESYYKFARIKRTSEIAFPIIIQPQNN